MRKLLLLLEVLLFFVVMNIIINVRRGSGVHNARHRKLPRGP